MMGNLYEDLFYELLSGVRNIPVELCKLGIRHPPSLPKESFPLVVKHPARAVVICEIFHVEAKTSIVLDVHQLVELIQISRFAVWSETHNFPLGVIDVKAQIGGQRTIKKPNRMRKPNHFVKPDRVAFTYP